MQGHFASLEEYEAVLQWSMVRLVKCHCDNPRTNEESAEVPVLFVQSTDRVAFGTSGSVCRPDAIS
jgi:hypothetical protein